MQTDAVRSLYWSRRQYCLSASLCSPARVQVSAVALAKKTSAHPFPLSRRSAQPNGIQNPRLPVGQLPRVPPMSSHSHGSSTRNTPIDPLPREHRDPPPARAIQQKQRGFHIPRFHGCRTLCRWRECSLWAGLGVYGSESGGAWCSLCFRMHILNDSRLTNSHSYRPSAGFISPSLMPSQRRWHPYKFCWM